MFNSDYITNVALVIWIVDHVVLSVRYHTTIFVPVHNSPRHLTHHRLGVVPADNQGLDGAPWELHKVKYFSDHGGENAG